MLLARALVLAGTALAAAAPPAGKTIKSAMERIRAGTTSLGDAVRNYPGTIIGVLPIADGSFQLLGDLTEGSRVAEASPPLTDAEAFDVATLTQSLVAAVNGTLGAIVAAKPKFDGLFFVSPIILISLKEQHRATSDFSAKVVEKIPPALQDIARTLIKPIDDDFAKAIDAYALF